MVLVPPPWLVGFSMHMVLYIFHKKNAFSGGFIDNSLYGRSRFIGRSKGYHIPRIFTMLWLITFLEKSFWTGISFNVSHYSYIILPIMVLCIWKQSKHSSNIKGFFGMQTPLTVQPFSALSNSTNVCLIKMRSKLIVYYSQTWL